MSPRLGLLLMVLFGSFIATRFASATEPQAMYCEAFITRLEGADREDARARCNDVVSSVALDGELEHALDRLAGLDGWLRLREQTSPTDDSPAGVEVMRILAAQRALLARLYPLGPPPPREERARRVPVESYCAQRVEPLPPKEHAEALLRCRDVAGELADAVRGPHLAADLDRLAALDGWLHARAAAMLLPEDAQLRAQVEALADRARKSSRDEGEMLSKMYPQRPAPRAKARAQTQDLPDPFQRAHSMATARKPAPPAAPEQKPRQQGDRHDLMDPFESR
ncbi:MAG: hypothetical protein ABI321_06380 [Polyangia bacterium]